jgi:hypothetical protein
MSDSNEQKKRNSEKINFAQQGATENAQFMIAITVGIFGILTMFLMINHDDTAHKVNLGLKLQNGFLGKGLWAEFVLDFYLRAIRVVRVIYYVSL